MKLSAYPFSHGCPGWMDHRARLLGGSSEPGMSRLGDALGAVVAPQVRRCSPLHQQPLQGLNDLPGPQMPLDSDGQALPGVLIQHDEDLHDLTSFRTVEQNVIRPDVVGLQCSRRHAHTRPLPTSTRALARQGSPLALPQAPDPFGLHPMPLAPQ
jgi:hypothetical protein